MRLLDLFEKFMQVSKYFILIAIFTSILSSIFLFLWSLEEFLLSLSYVFEITSKQLIIKIITTMDIFLLGIISLIFGWSLYDLYIRNPNDNEARKNKVSKSLIVYSLDELKEKLSKVVIIMLIITFFKYALYFEYKDIFELLFLSISIFFISLSIYFTKDKK